MTKPAMKLVTNDCQSIMEQVFQSLKTAHCALLLLAFYRKCTSSLHSNSLASKGEAMKKNSVMVNLRPVKCLVHKLRDLNHR